MGKTTFITLLAGLFLLHAPTTQAQGTPEKYRGANFTIETGRIRRRRQIPGKRISSVLLYGRLHFRQALVSRSRLLVRHLLSGRRRRQTNHPAAFRPDAIRFPNLTHHPLLSTRPRHTDFFRRSYRLPFPRLHGPPHHVRTAYLVLLPSGSGRVVPPAKTPGPSSRPRRHDKLRRILQRTMESTAGPCTNPPS